MSGEGDGCQVRETGVWLCRGGGEVRGDRCGKGHGGLGSTQQMIADAQR